MAKKHNRLDQKKYIVNGTFKNKIICEGALIKYILIGTFIG